jgi:hypothetical protein
MPLITAPDQPSQADRHRVDSAGAIPEPFRQPEWRLQSLLPFLTAAAAGEAVQQCAEEQEPNLLRVRRDLAGGIVGWAIVARSRVIAGGI